MTPQRAWFTMLVAAVLFLLASPAHALRAALIVGNNVGHAADQPLRYAESDAERIAQLLSTLAGFDPASTIVLKGKNANDIRRAFDSFAARLAQTPGDHLVVLYFSGHADGHALRLGSSTLPFTELKSRLLALPAAVRIAIVDACQSGTLTRMKGGRPGVAFDIGGANSPRGLAILASASDTELAQESDELRGSFFTHHLETGLRGLADRNRDGRVSLAEAFDFASERTLDTTLATQGGPQHPTFRYDLVGQRDVVLTHPKAPGVGYGRIVFDRPGWYFVTRQSGPIVAEVVSRGSEQIVLEAGSYELRRRDENALETATVRVGSGTRTVASDLATKRTAFGRAVRKGGDMRSHAYAVSLGGIVRSSLVSLGTASGAGASGRLDGKPGSLELRAAFARAVSSTYVPAETLEGSLTLAGLAAWDLETVTLAGGVEAGWAVFSQKAGSEPATLTNAPLFGPTALFEIPWGARFCVRGDLAAPIYVLRVESNAGEQVSWSPSVRGGLGVGGYF
jgi:hypothetical protein